MAGLFLNRDFDYQKNLEKAWEYFHCGLEIKESSIPKVILDSWRRSQKFCVDTTLAQGPNILDGGNISSESNANSFLLKSALPVIKNARTILEDYQLFMMLTSSNGKILDRQGSSKSLALADSQQLVVGSNWSEQYCGTNAVGMAVAIKRPVQVIAREHYCEMTSVWGCAAAPIKDLRDGRVLGILDTTGPDHSFVSMNMGWVSSMASCIEFRLQKLQNYSKYRLIDYCMAHTERWKKETIMIFDEEGFLVWVRGGSTSSQKEIPALLQNTLVDTRVDGMSVKNISLNNLPEGIDKDWLEPVTIDGVLVGHLLIIVATAREKIVPKNPVNTRVKETLLIGGSDSVLYLRELAGTLSESRIIVALTGETGTGKEVMAREIYFQGGLKGEFIAVNCGAIQKDLLASELFGYVEGSFSGAKRGGMIGKFEAAQNGTLFLDEFCELPLDLQVYLLRVLEMREIVRIGESKSRPINARIIIATNKNLEQEVKSGRLREDLYYRVSTAVIELPTLRERKDDILVLFDYFLKKLSEENHSTTPGSSNAFREALQEYRWPGNVRELRNFSENCILMNAGKDLTLDHCPQRMLKSFYPESKKTLSGCALKVAEQKKIDEALIIFEGNISKTAQYLGIARSTLYKKMENISKTL